MANFSAFNLRLLAAAMSGLLVASGFPGETFPFLSAAGALPVAFIPLFLAIYGLPKTGGVQSLSMLMGRRPPTPFERFRSAFMLTWITGVVAVAIGFYWCTYPAILFGGIPESATYPAFAVYAVVSGLFFPTMLFPFLVLVAHEGRRPFAPVSLIPVCLAATALEIWTPRFFHWSLGSLMHASLEVSQFASVLGFSGITLLILLSNAYLARAICERTTHPVRSIAMVAGVAAMWTLVLLWGSWRIDRIDAELAERGRWSHIGLIQPNYTFDELSSNPSRSSGAQRQSLDNLLEKSQELISTANPPLDLLVWPESVAPTRFALSESQMNRARDLAEQTNTPILVQATEFDEEEVATMGYRRATLYSSSFLLRPDRSRSPSYRKWVPIPFGEFVPFEDIWPELGDFVRNNVGNTSKVGRGSSYDGLPYSPHDYAAPLICFDAIEPELPRLQTRYGKATVLINQSNFVWMGRSNAGYEFKEIVRFRAIENGRSAIVAANTGPSVIFDLVGRELTETTALLKPDALHARVPVLDFMTLFTTWGHLPIHIGGGLGFLWLVMSLTRQPRKKPRRHGFLH
jgi:apolipoprotein N-acyltransferase